MEVNELDFECEGGVRWDHWWVAVWSVGKIGWSSDRRFGSLVQLSEALVPCFDDLTDTNLALEWLVPSNRGVED